MGKAGHITENYRAILKEMIMKDLPKDALLAVLDAIPSYPEKPNAIQPAVQAKPKRFNGRKKRQHPPPKSVDGKILARSINAFCKSRVPQIKYEGMCTAIDALTTCRSPVKDKYGYTDYEFHYDIIAYKRDGVYIERKSGRGYRTSAEETKAMRRQAGFTD